MTAAERRHRAEVALRRGVEIGLRRHLPAAARVVDEAVAHALDRVGRGDRGEHGLLREDGNLGHARLRYPARDAQRQALEHGVKFTGCTVHFVDETLDGGPIIAQRVVPVVEGDTVESLSARILEQEHQLYAEAVAQILSV